MEFLESEGEERGPQPDGDLGSGIVLCRGAVTEVTGTGGSLAGAQRGITLFPLCSVDGCRERCKLVSLVRGYCVVSVSRLAGPVISYHAGSGALKKGFSKIKARTQR